MAAKERGVVTFKLGGLEHRCEIPLRLALDVEEATGVGVIELGLAFSTKGGQLRHALEVVRLALAANGKQYESADVLAMCEHEGIGAASTIAARVINALFVRSKPGNAVAGQPSPAMGTSH